MRMSISTDGFINLILEKAVRLGIAKTKNEALRIGLLVLNKEYNLVDTKDIEKVLVRKKTEQEKEDMKKQGKHYLDEKQALKPYKKLLDKI
jgi:hypothetical protein